MDRRAELIHQVIDEIDRVFGADPGFGGEPQEYVWLLENYSIAEEEDVVWQEVCEFEGGDFGEGVGYTDDELAEREAFLEDDGQVLPFLERLLSLYRASTALYPR